MIIYDSQALINICMLLVSYLVNTILGPQWKQYVGSTDNAEMLCLVNSAIRM